MKGRSIKIARAACFAGVLIAAPAQPSAAATVPDPLAQPAAFTDPPGPVRPKFRWWWGDLTGSTPLDVAKFPEEVAAIADAGFGGVEIAFSSGTWANANQRAALQTALDAARKKGLQVDMTLGAAWPFQTPNTAAGTGLSEQELIYGRADVSGPTTFDGLAPAALDDTTGERRGKVVAVTAARVLDRGPAVTRAGTPPARATILDPASLVDLTDKLSADGRVHWEAPAGDWILFAHWQRDASEGVVDHLSADSARAAVAYIDQNQLGPEAAAALPGIGGSFFEDSLELDVSQLFWTGSFPQEFQAHRGYSLTRFLPLFYVQGMNSYWVPETEPTPDFELPGGDGVRYRHDYYETVTDLYVHNHIDEIAAWAKKHQMRFRSQVAYGNTFEVVRSAREITRNGGLADDESLNAGDIAPFDLTNRDWRFAMDHYRSIVSGAHQSGETEIGTELGAVFLRELMTSLPEYKRAMDKEWAAGIARPLIHGYTHQSQGATWPGTSRFAGLVSDSWNHRTFPQWAMFKPLADYWGRGALVMRQGRPRADVAVLRDGFIPSAATITGELSEIVVDYQLGDLPQWLRTPLQDALKGLADPRPKAFFDGDALERAGFTYQYLDPVGLREAQARGNGVLYPDGPAYRALVVHSDRLAGSSAKALDAASKRGLAVVFVDELPSRGTSAAAIADENGVTQRAIAAIARRKTTRVVAAEDEVLSALQDLGVRPAAEWSPATRVYTQRRDVGDKRFYYLWNPAATPVRFTASFLAAGRPSRLDLWTGAISALPTFTQKGDRVSLPLVLGPGETTVLAFAPGSSSRAHVVASTADELVAAGAGAVELRDRRGGTQTLRLSDASTYTTSLPRPGAPITVGGWALHVQTTGPEGATDVDVPLPAGLADWRTLIGLQSGTGTYTAMVTLPSDWTAADRGVALELGRIEGAVQVSVNDRLATPDVAPLAPVDVTPLLKPGANTLKVVLTTTLKNKAVSLLPVTLASRPILAAQPGTQTYGLLGPVRLIPDARATVALPALRSCASRRRFAITLRRPPRFAVRSAVLRVGTRERRVRVSSAGGRLRVVVDLRTRPRGRVRVRLVLRGRDGRRIATTRTYRLCTKRGART